MGLNIDKAYVGLSEVDKIYLGAELVWQNTERTTVEDAPNGTYILHRNGYLYYRKMWDKSNNQDAIGVAVVSDECKFVIYPTDSSIKLEFGGYGTLINGIKTTNSQDEACTDYEGKSNTNLIISQLGEAAKAANYCNGSTFKDNRKGYLGSLGEWKAVYDNIEEVDLCLSLIGGSELLKDESYWTSTQYNGTNMWAISIYPSEFYVVMLNKDLFYWARPFAPLT